MERVAVIDIGTNTSKIHIVQLVQDDFQSIRKEKIPTKLGLGGIEKMRICEEAILRLENAMQHFKQICLDEQCSNILSFATAMMRNSENGKEVAARIFEKTGLAIQIIDGQEEATLIFEGVSSCVKADIGQYLIMDIGGGSTEFILVENNEPIWSKSFQFGATSLLEKFIDTDPVEQSEVLEINRFLARELQELFDRVKGVYFPLIGSSGTFESIAEMIAHRKSKIDSYHSGRASISQIEDIKSLYDSIIQSNRTERRRMRGLPEFRVDTIVTAMITLNFLFSRIDFSAVHTAPYSLKEGAIFRYFLGETEHN